MENNNTPRKANLYYGGWKIPIVVLEENNNMYKTKLDPSRFSELLPEDALTDMRNAYVDVCCDSVGLGKEVPLFDAEFTSLALVKEEGKYTLVFEDSKPEQEEGEPKDLIVTGDVALLPNEPSLTELDKQLNLMAHLSYKVKSWDISFPEDGEPQLYATFTKVEAVHLF